MRSNEGGGSPTRQGRFLSRPCSRESIGSGINGNFADPSSKLRQSNWRTAGHTPARGSAPCVGKRLRQDQDWRQVASASNCAALPRFFAHTYLHLLPQSINLAGPPGCPGGYAIPCATRITEYPSMWWNRATVTRTRTEIRRRRLGVEPLDPRDLPSVVLTGPSSSASPYVLPTNTAVDVTSILTTGDSVGGYRMAGTPDGLGAFDNGDGTLTVLMNHEFTDAEGVAHTHNASLGTA